MKVMIISGNSGKPQLLADVLSAKRTTLHTEYVVLVETITSKNEYFRPVNFGLEEVKKQCDMFIRYIAQELQNGSDLVEVDEQAGFRYNTDGTIQALLRE